MRNGFLLVVLVWLGWTAGVQLSTVNVINYVMAPFNHFDIGFYLAEPLMVIVAAYTLISLVLIGRGVFCGWLCPFGALQELLAQVSRALRVPQWNPPAALEQRLWWGKYIAAAVVLILVITAGRSVGRVARDRAVQDGDHLEVHPRLALCALRRRAARRSGCSPSAPIAASCCPLGGILAALDRLHLINLLKRRPECGNPCHLCERSCPVRAIEKTGKIVTAECFQCLDCQVEYYDDKRCPPLVQVAKQRRELRPGRRRRRGGEGVTTASALHRSGSSPLPRAGEVGSRSDPGEGASREFERRQDLAEAQTRGSRPLTPTLSPHAGRGSTAGYPGTGGHIVTTRYFPSMLTGKVSAT